MTGVTAWTSALRRRVGERLGRYLTEPLHEHTTAAPMDPAKFAACLRPADVLLVEGNTRVSVAIKYLTQSTWSHAAIYVGPRIAGADERGAPLCFVEADLNEGVRTVGLEAFAGLHCRICRPVGLSADETDAVLNYVLARVGHRYDLKNVFDLARYLFPTPPVPTTWRRRMLALGSGDPTRAICSTLIALAFQSVRYPILPGIETIRSKNPACAGCLEEILRVRHHSLFVPRDFDVSPYFEIVKPTLLCGFDHRRLHWESADEVSGSTDHPRQIA